MKPSEIKAALSERAVVALTLRHEAQAVLTPQGWAKAPVMARIAVGGVIRNRVRAPGRFGTSFKDVCLKPAAFSCWTPSGDNNSTALFATAERLVRGERVNDAMLDECLWLADGIISGALPDEVKGATHYHTKAMNPYPSWTLDRRTGQRVPPIAEHGGHVFYVGIR